MFTINKLDSWLKKLGNTPKRVAESLNSYGIKGNIKDSKWNPIVIYIYYKLYKLDQHIEVSKILIKNSYLILNLEEIRNRYIAKTYIEFKLNQACREFVHNFDKGSYEFLRN